MGAGTTFRTLDPLETMSFFAYDQLDTLWVPKYYRMKHERLTMQETKGVSHSMGS